MTQKLANGDVCLLPMKNKICQQGRKVHSLGSAGWIAAALIAVVTCFGSVPANAATRRTRRRLVISTLVFSWLILGLPLVPFSTSGEAWAATLNSLQTGTTTVSGASTTVTITSVDITKAFLVFGVSENNLNGWDGQVSGQLTNATTITFARVGNGTPNPTVKWYVAEFASGVSVQRGAANMAGQTTVNATLTAVDTTKSFPIVTYRAAQSGALGAPDFLKAKITTTTNLQLVLQAAGSGSGAVAEWQVVTYAHANVTTGDVTGWTTASTSPTVSISDLSKAWLIYTYNTNTDTDSGRNLVRGQITDATTLTFDRNTTGSSINLTWYLVQFTDGTSVQRGSQAFTPATQTQADVTISAVNAGASIAVGGYEMRGGRSPDTTQYIGVGWFTFDLTSSTNLRITRGTTSSTADVGGSSSSSLKSRLSVPPERPSPR